MSLAVQGDFRHIGPKNHIEMIGQELQRPRANQRSPSKLGMFSLGTIFISSEKV